MRCDGPGQILTYALVFLVLLGSACVSKGVFLLMTSALGLHGHNITVCYGSSSSPSLWPQ